MKKQFEESGEILEVDLLAAFVALWRSEGSGSIRFSRPAASAGFDIASGQVVATFSSEPRFETSAILVRAGKLDAAALERLSIAPGGDAAVAALQAGILTRREWKWGEKIRAIEILADLLAWTDGRYTFDPTARPAAGEFTVTIPRLLLELFLRSRDRSLVEHQLGAPDLPLARSSDFDDLFPTFGLTADAESVVRLIDGRTTSAEIQERAPADDFAVAKLLAALATLGLIHAIERHPVATGPRVPEPFTPEVAAEDATAPSVEEPFESGTEEAEIASWHDEAPVREEPAEATPGSDELPAYEPPEPARPADAGLDRDLVGSSLEGDLPAAAPAAESAEELLTSWNAPAEASPDVFAPEPGLSSPLETPSPPRRGPGLLLTGLIVVLGAAILAVVLFRSRLVFPPGTTAPAPTPAVRQAAPARPTALAPIAVPPAETASAPGSVAVHPRAVSPRRAPPVATASQAAEPRPAEITARPAPAPAGREEWVRRARRDRNRLASDRRTRYAIQLELACEVPSLVEAWKHDRPSGSMWLLPVEHRGRDCFRVLWGRYPTLQAAKAGKARAPAFFATASNRPAVVAVR